MQQDSDKADIAREAIYPHSCTARYGCPTCEAALAALDALVAERDKANADWHRIRDLHDAAITGLRAAEAEVARLTQQVGLLDDEAESLGREADRLREALAGLMDQVERGDDPIRLHAAMQIARAALADPRNRDDNPHPDAEEDA